MAKQDEPNKVIYSMVGVGKVHGTKQVLKDIYLGYFYGAKIGVIGLNGSGKSTLLRIMAGVETSFIGEVAISPGYSVGFLEQEPQLDPAKTVLEVVKEGAAETVALLAEFEAISDKFAEPMEPDEMDKLLARQGALRRRAAPRRALQAAPAEARHPAPRRAHEPPRRRDRGVARAAPAEVRGHRHRRHP